MRCSKCGHDNRVEAKFCEMCATPLARLCASCGSRLSPIAKFCPECAHPTGAEALQSRFASPETYTPRHLAEKILTSKKALEGERKQITVLFADIKGSMEIFADRDPEAAQKIFDPVLERMIGLSTATKVPLTGLWATGSWHSSARRSPTRIMPCALVMRGFGCKRRSDNMQKRLSGLMGWRSQSESDSTRGRSLFVASATICTWITRSWVRPRTWRLVWNRWPSPVP